ncbi:MAG: diaminopimelate epimerase [Lentisphaerae bacterium GWF2_45_14]|nr:MAG: diaminopimelate epimerase [Lentisphaerae bacterium GWF2_45_14]
MKLEFTKMNGAGNDFIIACDNDRVWPSDSAFVKKICSRTRGVGADGLILLRDDKASGLIELKIFNRDGSEAEMCGNGLRCSTIFAFRQMGAGAKMSFSTAAGKLGTEVGEKNKATIEIPLLFDFSELNIDGTRLFYGNTGVPHAVVPVENLEAVDVAGQGRLLRNHDAFKPAGTNVDFILVDDSSSCAHIRTYERGVEAETSACGTGAAAVAVCLFKFFKKEGPCEIITTENDVLGVELIARDNIVSRIKLSGNALEVFRGKINTDDLR